MARCLLLQSGLPKFLWNHALRTAAYIRNRSYSKRLGSTPYEAFTQRRPNIKNMHPFGTACYAYKQDKRKLDPRAEAGRFIGYDYNSPAYLLYFAETHQIKKVRCVVFMDGGRDDDSEVLTQFPIVAQANELPQLVKSASPVPISERC